MDKRNATTLAIDFGTYNSMAVYATKDGDISIIQHEDKAAYTEKEALKTMPSFVYVNEDGKVQFVGNKAKELASEKPGNVVWGLKRLLGKTYNTLVSDGFIEKLDFSVEPDTENGKCILCFNAKHYFRPVELISHIFNQIQKDVEKNGITDIEEVVISVPAYYTPVCVSEIIDAAVVGGFDRRTIKTISEPIAAAIAFGTEMKNSVKTLLFDMGCGTTDISVGKILKNKEFVYEGLKNLGSRLGGFEIDECVLDFICETAKIDKNSLTENQRHLLRNRARKAKIVLSEKQETKIFIGDIVQKMDVLIMSQKQLNDVMKHIKNECKDLIMWTIEGAGLKINDIERLLIVGGPTIMPVFKDMFNEIFEKNINVIAQIKCFYSEYYKFHHQKINRMSAVAIGAALYHKTKDRQEFGYGIESFSFGENQTITCFPEILIPVSSNYPCESKFYQVPYSCQYGYYFKIIQVVPQKDFKGSRYQFIGVYKYRAKHIFSQIQIKMEMTQNKELKTTIQDIYSGEKFTYEGFKNNSSNEIDVIYPVKINTGEYKNEKHFVKEPPSQNVKVEFFLFIQGLTDLVEKNADRNNIPQTISDCTKILKDTTKDDIDKMNAVYCLIHNASFYGLLKEDEKAEAESLALELEQQLFKYKSLK